MSEEILHQQKVGVVQRKLAGNGGLLIIVISLFLHYDNARVLWRRINWQCVIRCV